jgi:micrococcal nuclease
MRSRRRGAALVAIAVLAVSIFRALGSEHVADPARSGHNGSADADVVVRVVDGDTVVLRSRGKSRLIGVDTPEVLGRRECFGEEASAFAKRTLRPGLHVKVRRDAEQRDRYGRSLIYLTLADGRSFNELLVSGGFAVPLTIAPNVRHAGRLRELARRARAERAGLWSPAMCDGHVGGSS